MNLSHEAVRKAAILISALDTAAADALLDSMDEALAARVRASYMELEDIDAGEQQRVIEQFIGGNSAASAPPTASSVDSSLDELQLSSAVPFADYLSSAPRLPSPAEIATETTAEENATVPFESLATATSEELAEMLCAEHPQTIAVVLANVTPATAAAALARLAPQQQAEVARRIVGLSQVDGHTLREIEHSLRQALGRRGEHPASRQSGLDAMKRIWLEASPDDKFALQSSFSQRDTRLLAELAVAETQSHLIETPSTYEPSNDHGPSPDVRSELSSTPTIDFEALTQLDNDSLGRVLRKAPGRLLLLALAGASAELIDRVYKQLPAREAQLLRRQIEQQGPISLRDVAEAQRRVARLASRMADGGEIEIPSVQPVAMAA